MKRIKYDKHAPKLTKAELRDFRRVTPEEHARFHEAYVNTFGKEPPRRGRPKKGKDKYVPMYMKIHPRALAWAKATAARQSKGYQTVINEVLLRQAGEFSR
jgi:uncharacterized protein (DUF4415 family)